MDETYCESIENPSNQRGIQNIDGALTSRKLSIFRNRDIKACIVSKSGYMSNETAPVEHVTENVDPWANIDFRRGSPSKASRENSGRNVHPYTAVIGVLSTPRSVFGQ